MPQFVIEEYFVAYISPLFISHEFYKRLVERVKFALNSNDEITLRTIYDDLLCRFDELFAPSHLFKSIFEISTSIRFAFSTNFSPSFRRRCAHWVRTTLVRKQSVRKANMQVDQSFTKNEDIILLWL